MSVADDIKQNASDTLGTKWTVRDGQVVPEASDLKLTNDAVRFEKATVLYADLDQSTDLVETKKWQFSGEVYKTFLYAASRLIQIIAERSCLMTATGSWAFLSQKVSATTRSLAP